MVIYSSSDQLCDLWDNREQQEVTEEQQRGETADGETADGEAASTTRSGHQWPEGQMK